MQSRSEFGKRFTIEERNVMQTMTIPGSSRALRRGKGCTEIARCTNSSPVSAEAQS
ncbi:MAG: hypothetical protein J7M14_07115 [Planctomycetes bacterium]|nr:hypothetical protein [Planctomycetota bacterium]